MSIVPKKVFINNEIPLQFNTDSFETTTLNSDNLSGLSLDVSGQSNLNNVDLIGNLNSVNIVNSGSITSESIVNTGALTSGSITNTGALSSVSITNSGALTSNTITSTNLLTCSNGLTVSSGTVSFQANVIGLTVVNGLNSRLTKLDNLSGGVAVNSTISSNVLTINYTSNNGQSIFITPTANFSLVLTNVPTGSVNAIYKLEIYINAKFYCNSITVNGTAINMTSVGGFSNITINASATGLIQQFVIFFTGSSTPSKVSTILLSTW